MLKNRKKVTVNSDRTNEDVYFREHSESYGKLVFRRFCKHKLALIGCAVLIVLILIAIFAPFLAPYDPEELHLMDLRPGAVPAAPSPKYPLGTDNLGRDILSRSMYGARVSLSVGFVAVGISVLIGVPLGVLMGYYGGVIDFLGSRLIDFLCCIPTFFLILIANTFLPPSIFNVMFILGIFGWMGIARLVRGQVLSLRNQDFVQAAIALGYPESRIMFKHILPHALVPVIVSATMGVGGAITSESGLSYLGLGVQEPNASWGAMLKTAQQFMQNAPTMAVTMGILITLTVLSLNFIGDALRDALDPRAFER